MKEAKRSLIEVIIGIWFLAVVVILAGVFFVPSKIPYVLGEVTGSLVATLMMVHLYHCLDYEGIKWQKWGRLKGLFEPIFLFFPINVISEFATPISLSLRLFANILAGTMMMALIYGLLPHIATLIWPAALHAYLDVFAGVLQSYVFAMLTMVFIANAADIQEE